MLSPNYSYLFLDFETTGLDLSSDFPIQIGLIETDHNFTTKKYYSNYICLPDGITKLRNNVSYITGINIETIEKEGKALEIVQEEIQDFFGPDTIIIGQNIGFDIGFLKKFFPGLEFAHQIDTYPLAASSIPYLKSYSLESIDQELSKRYPEYSEKKKEVLNTISKEKSIAAHDALYDCGNGLCVWHRWTHQVESFSNKFPIVKYVINRTSGELKDFFTIEKEENQEDCLLPSLTSPLSNEKKVIHSQTINRQQQEQHSKRSTSQVGLEDLIDSLPHPCIIAVSHGSKIDIIKKNCKNENFDYLKEEQVLDQEKLKLRCNKETYTNEELLFVIFYLSHYRDGYRIIQANLGVHKYIMDYLQVKKVELKKDKKILCTHGGLYYTVQNNPERQDIYKDYPICILDADRRHTTYNDYAQKGIFLSSLLYQREKFDYTAQQSPSTNDSDSINTIITTLSFFIAHFENESEKYFQKKRQNKREIQYIMDEPDYSSAVASWKSVQELRKEFITNNTEIPKYLIDIMEKIDILFQNPIKTQRNSNTNKQISYSIGAAVRYIDFAEYLKMFGQHKTFFFSAARKEYKKFLAQTQSTTITILHEDSIEKTKSLIEQSSGSVFIVSHNSEKSKKIFNLLYESGFGTSHNLIGEYLTGGVAKSATKEGNDKPSIIIGGYHMLLNFRGEGKKIDTVIISYIPNAMNNFIDQDIQQYAVK